MKYSSLSVFLLVSSYNVNFHYDAGLYHLNNQLWLRESNIVQGFSNIYGAFGVSLFMNIYLLFYGLMNHLYFFILLI